VKKKTGIRKVSEDEEVERQHISNKIYFIFTRTSRGMEWKRVSKIRKKE